MGPWPHADSWPQSLPVFAGPEFGLGRALTIRTTASILSVAICDCVTVLTNEQMRCLPGSCLLEQNTDPSLASFAVN